MHAEERERESESESERDGQIKGGRQASKQGGRQRTEIDDAIMEGSDFLRRLAVRGAAGGRASEHGSFREGTQRAMAKVPRSVAAPLPEPLQLRDGQTRALHALVLVLALGVGVQLLLQRLGVLLVGFGQPLVELESRLEAEVGGEAGAL